MENLNSITAITKESALRLILTSKDIISTMLVNKNIITITTAATIARIIADSIVKIINKTIFIDNTTFLIIIRNQAIQYFMKAFMRLDSIKFITSEEIIRFHYLAVIAYLDIIKVTVNYLKVL